MEKLTKQEQAEALAKVKSPAHWGNRWKENVSNRKIKLVHAELIEKEIPNVERLHANGFEIVRKEQEDG